MRGQNFEFMMGFCKGMSAFSEGQEELIRKWASDEDKLKLKIRKKRLCSHSHLEYCAYDIKKQMSASYFFKKYKIRQTHFIKLIDECADRMKDDDQAAELADWFMDLR